MNLHLMKTENIFQTKNYNFIFKAWMDWLKSSKERLKQYPAVLKVLKRFFPFYHIYSTYFMTEYIIFHIVKY